MPSFFTVQRREGPRRIALDRPSAPAVLADECRYDGATAFLIIMAITFGLILPRMLFERVLPSPRMMRHDRSTHRSAVQD